ncbi:uncharacterized protein LOC144924839 [Branchiostoma floridae x Branchiostoma belcheri]
MPGILRQSQSARGGAAVNIPMQQSVDWRALANIAASVPNTLYVSRADVSYGAVATDNATKCCSLRKKMLQTAGIVFAMVIFFLLPYFAVKVATLSDEMAKLSEGLEALSEGLGELKKMTQLRFAKLEREIES